MRSKRHWHEPEHHPQLSHDLRHAPRQSFLPRRSRVRARHTRSTDRLPRRGLAARQVPQRAGRRGPAQADQAVAKDHPQRAYRSLRAVDLGRGRGLCAGQHRADDCPARSQDAGGRNADQRGDRRAAGRVRPQQDVEEPADHFQRAPNRRSRPGDNPVVGRHWSARLRAAQRGASSSATST